MSANQQTITELYASNKKLNEKVQTLSHKVDNNNKEILKQLKELNSSVKCILLQNKKLMDKIDKDNDIELKARFINSNESMNKLLLSINKTSIINNNNNN
jgi:hypothetical protein